MSDLDTITDMITVKPIRIGTRGSPLALWQARAVAAGLEALDPGAVKCEIVVISTTGDREQGRRLSEIGGKGLFTKEIEEGLMDESIDCAVHSLKDMPTELPDGLVLTAMLPRADTADSLITLDGRGVEALRDGAVVGTASLRRQSQILARRPDLKVVTFRGNVQTRLRKLREGEVDATLLAEAGLQRLGMEDLPRQPLPPSEMLPAVGQGAVCVEIKEERTAIASLIRRLNHLPTELEVTAERAMLAVLDGSCRTPIAGLARCDGDALTVEGLLALPDGSRLYRAQVTGKSSEAAEIGRRLGEELLDKAGPGFREEMERWM